MANFLLIVALLVSYPFFLLGFCGLISGRALLGIALMAPFFIIFGQF